MEFDINDGLESDEDNQDADWSNQKRRLL